ncbi:bifunctional diacylglycerol diphosphate phosphatase/phosphatidate phosphatase [Sparganum proliferum]
MEDNVLAAPDVLCLDVRSFDLLSESEKRYLYALDEVAWIGGLIDLIQLSPEAAGIFLLSHHVFQKQTVSEINDLAKSNGIRTEDVDAFIAYFASIYGNLGNYLSFGDTKFIPAVSREVFTNIIELTDAYKSSEIVREIFERVIDSIYSTHPGRLRLAFPPEGITTYYSSNCTRADAELVQSFLNSKKMEAYNTRLVKSFEKDAKGRDNYALLVASAECREEEIENSGLPHSSTLKIRYGDYHELMQLIVSGITAVKAAALNDNQKKMWSEYQRSFQTGSIEAHKAGSRHWVADKQPAVESYIGFIESYRDPYGVRGEFETFVAVVDKDVSAKFQSLVNCASSFLPLLPWPSSYEKDVFLEPDFTSLDIMSFATSGLPVGINIPNYDDIRQDIGFKNVSLGNVLKARFQDPTATFLCEKDKQCYLTNVGQAFEIQVGLHELLGHGSGKLFRRKDDGSFNFRSSVRDLLTGGDLTYWYEPGETWDSKFSSLASPFEECRAECVGIYLCDVADVLKIFDPENKFISEDVVYINWLSMVRSGLMSLEFFTPPTSSGDSGAWRQAHCQARFAIFKVILDCDPPVLQIETVKGEDKNPDLRIHLDRSKLQSVAKPAVGEFLRKLQYYKSTGNVKDGSTFFLNYCTPASEHMEWRKIVIARKKPRPFYVQPVTFENANKTITLKNYPGNNEGMIQSFIDRYSSQRKFGPAALKALKAVWDRDQAYFYPPAAE